MRIRPASPVVFVVCCLGLLVSAAGSACAQAPSLQPPPAAPPKPDGAPKAPAAAPRQPVHQAGSQPQAKPATPVVKPQGPVQPKKPAQAQKPPETPAATVIVVPVPVPMPVPMPGKPEESEKPDGKALKEKIPRFVSLRSDEVNLRAGPGTRYPIEWVYRRRDLPMEVEREFDAWRLVRDMDGIRGWVHQATLNGRRHYVTKVDTIVRSDPKEQASAVAMLKAGVLGRIRSCDVASDWCQVQQGSYRGYLKRDQIWGLLPKEAVSQ